MDHYSIRLYKKAKNDLDTIYSYIAIEKESIINAKKITDKIYRKIKSLEYFPYSHQDRLVGKYANQGYKQLVIENYIVIYKIDEIKKMYILSPYSIKEKTHKTPIGVFSLQIKILF